MADFQVDVEEIPPKSLMVNMYEALYSQLIYKFQPYFLWKWMQSHFSGAK